MGACKETGDIAGANFQEYVPFPISQDAGEKESVLRADRRSGGEPADKPEDNTGRYY